MRYWPKTEKVDPPARSVTITTGELARVLHLPEGVVIKDAWTVDYGSRVRFIIGDYSDSRPPR